MTEPWHGTLGGYTNHRCRCDDCRATWAAYHREYARRSVRRRTKIPENERTAQTRQGR